MKLQRSICIGGVVLGAIALAIGGWHPPAKADDNPRLAFAPDASWPKPLPAPVGSDGVAHPWVQGESGRKLR